MRSASISARASDRRMTALEKYARLEAAARYFDGRSGRPREVMVSFGERSLVILGFDDAAVAHWPLATLKAVSDRGDATLQVAPDLESEERLVTQDREMIRAIEAVCPGLRHRPADRTGIRRAALWSGAAFGAVLLLVFVILPGLAERLAPLIPPEQERQLGNAVVIQMSELLGFRSDGVGFCRAEAGEAALAQMAARLDAVVDLPAELAVAVMDHNMTNAFAAPGGRVVLFRGLIEGAESPEEVAGVLAHELGHVLHRDPTVVLLRSAGTAGILGMMVGDVFGATIVVAGSEALLNARYRREVEARADRVAIEMLERAGLPSLPFAAFFRRLAEQYGGDPGVLGYLASHPALDSRVRAATEGDTVGSERYDPALDDAAWLQLREICAATAPRPGPGFSE